MENQDVDFQIWTSFKTATCEINERNIYCHLWDQWEEYLLPLITHLPILVNTVPCHTFRVYFLLLYCPPQSDPFFYGTEMTLKQSWLMKKVFCKEVSEFLLGWAAPATNDSHWPLSIPRQILCFCKSLYLLRTHILLCSSRTSWIPIVSCGKNWFPAIVPLIHTQELQDNFQGLNSTKWRCNVTSPCGCSTEVPSLSLKVLMLTYS
jgi:hypothetical protein